MGKQFSNQPSEWDRQLWSRVYAYLMAELDQGGLIGEHYSELRDRGLSDTAIQINGYRSLGPDRNEKAAVGVFQTFGSRIWDVPGIVRRPDKRPDLAVSQGLLIPMKNHDGWVRAAQVRTNQKGSKYVWFTQGGRQAANTVHFSRRPHVGDWWAITEGPLKADVAQHLWAEKVLRKTAELGDPTFISSGGVSSWRAAVDAVFQNDIPKPEGVIVAFDQDGKPGTLAAQGQLISALKKNNVEVIEMLWDGKDKGIDDALLAGQVPSFKEI